MAGSYNHIVDNNGDLGSNERIVDMLENGGDVFECIEEMYGMIWLMATKQSDQVLILGPKGAPTEEQRKEQADAAKALVEWVRQNYQAGLASAKEIHRLSPDQREE